MKINEVIFVWVLVVEILCKMVFVFKGCIFVCNDIKNIELGIELLWVWME